MSVHDRRPLLSSLWFLLGFLGSETELSAKTFRISFRIMPVNLVFLPKSLLVQFQLYNPIFLFRKIKFKSLVFGLIFFTLFL